MMQKVRNLFSKSQGFIEILKYFNSPWSVILLRLGIKKSHYYFYQIEVRGKRFAMLARPQASALSDLNVLRTVLVQGEYGRILQYLPEHPLRIVDVGSNIGSFAVWISKERKVDKIYCFEPDQGSSQLCSFNLIENQCHQASVIKKAAGGFPRIILMPATSDQPCGQNIYASASISQSTQEVEVILFKEWVMDTGGIFDLLKLDCEGAEWEIVRKTPADILLRFGLIVAEIHADPDEQESPADFHRHLEKCGFTTLLDEGVEHGLYIGIKK
jgi:FkbM family methyltransferase